MNQFIEAVERGELHDFRYRYRHADVLAVDDGNRLGTRILVLHDVLSDVCGGSIERVAVRRCVENIELPEPHLHGNVLNPLRKTAALRAAKLQVGIQS